MSKPAIRLLTLAIFVTSMVMAPTVELAKAGSKTHKMIQRSLGVRYSYAGQAWPSGPVCPGLGRSFDCKLWPPPFDQDPDRRDGDGGG